MPANPESAFPGPLDRYVRQIRFAPLGEEGQRRLRQADVLLIGCGALGSISAEFLVRAGVGRLRIADRDLIDLANLHRQMLFDEADLAGDLPKAEAARRKLQRINSDVDIQAHVTDVTSRNIRQLAEGADLILDGCDNFETRYLINDLAVATNRPWIYGACVGASGLAMAVIPGETPCLRCIFEQPPAPEHTPTCDTAGILGPVAGLVASFQAMEAIKLLAGQTQAVDRKLWSFDAWAGRSMKIDVSGARQAGDCPCCRGGKFVYLEVESAPRTIKLCGRNAVQIHVSQPRTMDFAALAAKLQPLAKSPPRFNSFLFKVQIERYELTLFADGRALIRGTENPDEARSIYARTIGA